MDPKEQVWQIQSYQKDVKTASSLHVLHASSSKKFHSDAAHKRYQKYDTHVIKYPSKGDSKAILHWQCSLNASQLV